MVTLAGPIMATTISQVGGGGVVFSFFSFRFLLKI